MGAKDIEDKGVRFCRICKQKLTTDKFYKRENGKCELVCKICRNKIREKNHRYYRQQFIYKLSEYLDIKCQRCGYSRNFSALDFHHKGEKSMSIAREIRNLTKGNFVKGGKVDKILNEILNECNILCSNCHREHHTKYHMNLNKVEK